MFLSVMNVLLALSLEHSHFINKDIYQFLIMIWCVHSFWFIEDLSSRTEHEVFDSHEWWDTYVWVEQVIINKLSYKNSSESVSLKSIPSLLEIKF